MASNPAQTGAVVFIPSVGRFMLTELWSLMLSLGGGAILLYFWGPLNWTEAAAAGGIGLLGIAIGAAFQRQSRRLAIGDTWISGPTRGSSDSTTISFTTLDVASSGFRKGRLRIQSSGGQQITARMAWYSPDEVAEIQCLARDRCGIMALPE